MISTFVAENNTYLFFFSDGKYIGRVRKELESKMIAAQQ
jgi:hypothetical protein